MRDSTQEEKPEADAHRESDFAICGNLPVVIGYVPRVQP
jgi:hypothetical protein